jgi:hypothetical protein
MTFSGVQAPPCSVVKCVSVCVVPIDAGGGVLKIFIIIVRLLFQFLYRKILFQPIVLNSPTGMPALLQSNEPSGRLV